MSPNDAEGIANSADPDQTAPPGAVGSRSALFAQANLSENFRIITVVIKGCTWRIFVLFVCLRFYSTVNLIKVMLR